MGLGLGFWVEALELEREGELVKASRLERSVCEREMEKGKDNNGTERGPYQRSLIHMLHLFHFIKLLILVPNLWTQFYFHPKIIPYSILILTNFYIPSIISPKYVITHMRKE